MNFCELPKNKASTFKDILVKIMVNSVLISFYVLTKFFNDFIKKGNHLDIFKHADITLVFKKSDTTDKTNDRPIITLSNFAKVFVKMIYAQINSFMEPKLSKHLHYATTLCNYEDNINMYFLDFTVIPEWFYENYMVLNPDKCHFLTLGFNKPFPDFSFENTIIKNDTEENILEIVIDNNLHFKSYMKRYVKKLYLQEFQNKQLLLRGKNNKFFYQCSTCLLSFDMDVFFKGNAVKELTKYTR